MAKKLFVGVDLGGTSMRAGVVTKDGEVLALEKRKTKPELGAKEVVERLAETIKWAVKASDFKMKDIGGIEEPPHDVLFRSDEPGHPFGFRKSDEPIMAGSIADGEPDGIKPPHTTQPIHQMTN